MHSSTARIMRPHEWFVSAAIVGLDNRVHRPHGMVDGSRLRLYRQVFLPLGAETEAFDIAYGLFGYGLHPLFEIVNGSIAGFRRTAAFVLAIFGIIAALIAIGSATTERWGQPACNLSPFHQRYLSLTTVSG